MTVVRPAGLADIEELVRLRAHLLDAPDADLPYKAGGSAAREAWRRDYRAWLTAQLTEPEGIRVAVVPLPDGTGLAACATAIVDRRAPSPACPSGRAGWLQSVVVDPASRGQGLGARLLEHLHGWLAGQGVDEVLLQTTENATGFYRRLGFASSGEELLFRTLTSRSVAA
ncbi:GNAT family N-acetyltransferase [Streptomyces griseorubiginosus]|uniref:GNAT family N-acetyltransferase n=1 Tax=Streptomyces griseorubiginosus TaxID=67304 RepID=UPI00368D5D10